MTPSRPRALLFAIACIATIVVSACGASTTNPRTIARAPTAMADAPFAGFAPTQEAPADDEETVYSACNAPSVLRLHAADDARDPDFPSSCAPEDAWTRTTEAEQAAAAHCDVDGRPVDLARLLEGALPLDPDTTAHVRRVFQSGQSRGRRSDAFGLIGDSMTLAWNFLSPFADGAAQAIVPAEVKKALALASPIDEADDVLALFRGARRHRSDKIVRVDPVVAPRAAKVGVRASWPLSPRGPQESSPLDEMVAAVSPAYAVVLYGANDAVWHTESLDALVRDFISSLSAIVDALESRGIVPVLTTVPKHMRARGWPDCAQAQGGLSNERFAVQATTLSSAVADVACRRHLPLIDLRWSLDPLVYHGVGPDGIHLSAHRLGGGVLDESGLRCGYNVRNLVTLRELALVVDAVSTRTKD